MATQQKRKEAQRNINQQQQNDGENGHIPGQAKPGIGDNNVSA